LGEGRGSKIALPPSNSSVGGEQRRVQKGESVWGGKTGVKELVFDPVEKKTPVWGGARRKDACGGPTPPLPP